MKLITKGMLLLSMWQRQCPEDYQSFAGQLEEILDSNNIKYE